VDSALIVDREHKDERRFTIHDPPSTIHPENPLSSEASPQNRSNSPFPAITYLSPPSGFPEKSGLDGRWFRIARGWRKVRAPQDRMPANGRAPRGDGKCNRKQTATLRKQR
jgi:hypothetical protein